MLVVDKLGRDSTSGVSCGMHAGRPSDMMQVEWLSKCLNQPQWAMVASEVTSVLILTNTEHTQEFPWKVHEMTPSL
jgi:hypothetical protein